MSASKKLVKLRKERNLTQNEVAKKINVSTSTIAMMETGERRGSDKVKKKLADFYCVSVEELFFSE